MGPHPFPSSQQLPVINHIPPRPGKRRSYPTIWHKRYRWPRNNERQYYPHACTTIGRCLTQRGPAYVPRSCRTRTRKRNSTCAGKLSAAMAYCDVGEGPGDIKPYFVTSPSLFPFPFTSPFDIGWFRSTYQCICIFDKFCLRFLIFGFNHLVANSAIVFSNFLIFLMLLQGPSAI